MPTKIRAELSRKNKYYVEKHRFYELKHFCLQYPEWKKAYAEISRGAMYTTSLVKVSSDNRPPRDIVAEQAMKRFEYLDKIEMIEQAAIQSDCELHDYILKGVTEELSYTYLNARLGMPCSKDTYYDRYHKFFWILDKMRK